MKVALLILTSLLLTGCGVFFYKPMAERKEDCVERFIKMDIDGLDAAQMCEMIHKKAKHEGSYRQVPNLQNNLVN
jgi:hypothetical protein